MVLRAVTSRLHASTRFAQRLESLELKPAHAGILKAIDQSDGLSQQALCERIGVFSSRLVGLLDELEQRGLVERRDNPADRRSYAVHLTVAGPATRSSKFAKSANSTRNRCAGRRASPSAKCSPSF